MYNQDNNLPSYADDYNSNQNNKPYYQYTNNEGFVNNQQNDYAYYGDNNDETYYSDNDAVNSYYMQNGENMDYADIDEELEQSLKRERWKTIYMLVNFFGTIVGVLFIFIFVAIIISLVLWLKADFRNTFRYIGFY